MTRRSYRQNCGLALSLDLLGERWTLLILRELFLGPKRFGDLAERLPGIGTNILAARLGSLQAGEVVRATELPPPAKVAAYELTERGRELRPMLDGLALWGFQLFGDGTSERTTRPSWVALSMRAAYAANPDLELRLLANLTVDEETMNLRIDGPAAEVQHGPAANAEVEMKTDLATFLAIADGRLSPGAAEVDGRILLRGEREPLDRALKRFRLPVT